MARCLTDGRSQVTPDKMLQELRRVMADANAGNGVGGVAVPRWHDGPRPFMTRGGKERDEGRSSYERPALSREAPPGVDELE